MLLLQAHRTQNTLYLGSDCYWDLRRGGAAKLRRSHHLLQRAALCFQQQPHLLSAPTSPAPTRVVGAPMVHRLLQRKVASGTNGDRRCCHRWLLGLQKVHQHMLLALPRPPLLPELAIACCKGKLLPLQMVADSAAIAGCWCYKRFNDTCRVLLQQPLLPRRSPLQQRLVAIATLPATACCLLAQSATLAATTGPRCCKSRSLLLYCPPSCATNRR
jgi:hypothetical protein